MRLRALVECVARVRGTPRKLEKVCARSSAASGSDQSITPYFGQSQPNVPAVSIP